MALRPTHCACVWNVHFVGGMSVGMGLSLGRAVPSRGAGATAQQCVVSWESATASVAMHVSSFKGAQHHTPS